MVWASYGDTAIYLPILGLIIAAVVVFLPNGLVSLLPGAQSLRRRGRRLIMAMVRKL
ncbi:MAG: hypothetical protein U5L11_03140 [Arhodomonas sp.]|nr:hypothetical protein [Arhodomonas sp.]